MSKVTILYFLLMSLIGFRALTSPSLPAVENADSTEDIELINGKLAAAQDAWLQTTIIPGMKADLAKMQQSFEELANQVLSAAEADKDFEARPILTGFSQLIFIAEKSLEDVQNSNSSPELVNSSIQDFNQAKAQFAQGLVNVRKSHVQSPASE